MENQPIPQAVLITADPADIEKNRFYALLAYLGILFLIPLFFARHSVFARFHLNQGMILFVGWILWFLLGWVPIIGGILGMALAALLLILQVSGLITVLMGKMKKLFLIGKWQMLKD